MRNSTDVWDHQPHFVGQMIVGGVEAKYFYDSHMRTHYRERLDDGEREVFIEGYGWMNVTPINEKD